MLRPVLLFLAVLPLACLVGTAFGALLAVMEYLLDSEWDDDLALLVERQRAAKSPERPGNPR